jgi:hypothetical protein
MRQIIWYCCLICLALVVTSAMAFSDTSQHAGGFADQEWHQLAQSAPTKALPPPSVSRPPASPPAPASKPDSVSGPSAVSAPPPSVEKIIDARTLHSRINAVGKSVENEIHASNNTVNDIKKMLAASVISKKQADELSSRIKSHMKSIDEILSELDTVNADRQLTNIDLQNFDQKRQQYQQMLSDIMKRLHDTSAAIIRNMK